MNAKSDKQLYTKVEISFKLNDPELVVDQDFENTITCLICQGIIINPIQCKTCKTVFCKKCITDWLLKKNACPYNHPYEEEQLNWLTKNMMNNVKIKCIYAVNGCGKIITYESYFAHCTNECPFIQYQCKGCNKKFLQQTIEEHVRACSAFIEKDPTGAVNKPSGRKLKCQYCQGSYTENEMKIHGLLCEERDITCFLCCIIYKEKNQMIHQAECRKKIQESRKLLQEKITELTESNKKLQQSIQELQDQNKINEETIQALQAEKSKYSGSMISSRLNEGKFNGSPFFL